MLQPTTSVIPLRPWIFFGAVNAPRAEEGDCITASLCQGADEPQQLPQGSGTEFSGETDTSCHWLRVQCHPWVT